MSSSHGDKDASARSAGGEQRYSFAADAAQATRVADSLREAARGAAERQKIHGAAQLNGLAQAIRRTAQELQPQLPQTAAFIQDAAGGLERLSASLRTRGVGELGGTFTRVASERPAAVFAGAVFIGFVLTQVLRNSKSRSDR